MDGFNVNVFGGVATLDSTVSFPATATTPAAKFVDLGGDGLLIGARAGWGRSRPSGLYLGAELGGILPHGVTSRLSAFGIEYRARFTSELGAYGRIGFTPGGGHRLCARAGVSVPRQAFESAGGVPSSDRWTPAPAVGVGAEVALAPRWAARFDTTYSFPSSNTAIESWPPPKALFSGAHRAPENRDFGGGQVVSFAVSAWSGAWRIGARAPGQARGAPAQRLRAPHQAASRPVTSSR
jgi:hypothetical protein